MTELRSDFVRKRYAAERRFRFYGAAALAITGVFLAFVIVDIVIKGWPAFTEHRALVDVTVDAAKIDTANPAKVTTTPSSRTLSAHSFRM